MALTDLEPVSRQSTAEFIADRLRDAIMKGALEPGTQLGEADLAAHFQVSRGPLREAMQRLVSEGILHSIRHRGIFVTELTLDDVVDVYRSRSVIERGALEMIFDDGLREDVYRALEAPVIAMKAAAERGDAAAVSDADQLFHQVLVEGASSPRLVRAARTLLIETRMCLGALQTTYEDIREQAQEHDELREAIRTGTREEVQELLAEHLDDAVQRLRADQRTLSS
ncbi:MULTISPECIES: GntR family transcriptional regulator [Rhodococcus]|uniref:GntR family transcriptional regulator n=1 Tax=Rhodococcus oxybenzonivorans TaxID=1990687 RepID=A0AAE4UZR1_9NOCA|nr:MULTISPECIES: GntR family transcriptional regulator [Rhodococcus]MDV7241219.1 GntR family transcriptional regulator [Rhodococcus oxybenzonivorans]MDV7265697.1 GntR family transcriptional regulator [Rhodococcus oxybenzonivorans]MDV7273492.1 GntR family transcriptional regulator [Rhodococcus oxybenzonivorans]MDV7332770.1 GntR family transcriptional regulator [Rhodococcus oxybenzonivorans]MDV7341936.1 GntR family transcriptional regulator [Rhodococcus oxybenzonivorans]